VLIYEKPIDLKVQKDTGYEYFNDPAHPLARGNSGKVYYHRHVASVSRGRWLTSREVVHHIDGDRTNNSPNNLLVTTNASHGKIHQPRSLGERRCKKCRKSYLVKSKRQQYCSPACSHLAARKAIRPSLVRLRKETDKMGFCAVGRKYGVTDNAVRKWMRLK